MTLADLPDGASATIEGIDADRALRRRLLDLGLVPGTPARLVGRAPLGDPLEFELRGDRLSLRASEARGVRVQPRAAG